MQRPVGVTVIAIIGIIYGGFNLLLALLALLGSAILASGVAPRAIKYTPGQLAYALISDALIGILFLAFGIGALSLKRWAWIAGVVALGLEVVRQIVGVAIQGFGPIKVAVALIYIVIALVLLWYLIRPNVRAAFG